jgi:hypothetical protein
VTQFFMAEPDPEEVDRAHAAHMAGAHAVNRLLEELTEDQFGALNLIFDSISLASNPVRIASYMSGRITQRAQERFSICAACNKNHDKEAEALLTAPVVDDKPEVPPFVAAKRKADEVFFMNIGSVSPLSTRELELMQEYDLDDLREEDTNKLVGFICNRCGMKYVSIQDRMVNPPGEANCTGCVHKTQWG